MAPLRKRPHWWEWELELTGHVEERMVERGANPLALRWMLLHCTACRRSRERGRFVAQANYRGVAWEIVLEPDYDRECVVVVTMYTPEDP
jgi:hypothetical protein